MNYNETKDQLIKSYQDLLEVQYYSKENARKHIKVLCDSLLANLILFRIQDERLNVDLSVGVQLDIIGKWVGVSRFWSGSEIDGDFYAYYDWDEARDSKQGGYYNWNNIDNPDHPFITYDDIVSTSNKLSDEDFRNLIKLKIIKNSVNMTCFNIDKAINDLFNGTIYTVWGDSMELTYYYSKDREKFIQLAYQKNVLPHPTGVKLNLQAY